MTNSKLGKDYKKRAKGRLKAIETLLKEKLYADVVGECQESCELALKGMIRDAGHTVPYSHDVSEKLLEIKGDLPVAVQGKLDVLVETSKELRRDRELAFYGSEDITPSEFYKLADAKKAIARLKVVLKLI